MAILNDSDFVEVEGRYYTNPQVALDESNRFIDNLRSTQQANNQQIQTETYNLGTAVPSNLGGLTSPVTDGNGGAGMSYFTSRYEVPQTNSAVANLRAAAQAQALNEVLANEQAIWKNRYQNAYRDYQRKAYNRSRSGGGSGGGGGTPAVVSSGGAQRLPIDTNSDNGSGRTYVDTNKSVPGVPEPLTNTSMKYQDPNTGKWYVLTNPREIDAINVTSSLAGRNPKDGMTTTANGKVFRYVGPKDAWYEQVYMFGQG